MMDGIRERGEITRVLTAGRHPSADQKIYWQASSESPLYVVETEEGIRHLVPHVFALKT